MERKSVFAGAVASVLLALLLCAATVVAQDSDNGTFSVASLDLRRIQQEYMQPNSVPEGLRLFLEQSQQFLDELRNKYSFVSEQGFQDIVDILQMPRPLSAEATKRKEELAEVSAQNEKRFLELRSMTERTPEQQDEFDRLQTAHDACQRRIEELQKQLQTRLNEEQRKVIAKLGENVVAAVKLIAEQNGYDLVVDGGMVLYGAEDITEAVLQELLGRKPQAGSEKEVPAPEQDPPDAEGSKQEGEGG